MKYCSHCGKEVDDEAYVCPNCGCKIAQSGDSSLSPLSIAGFVLAFIIPLIGLIVSIVARNNAVSEDDKKSAGFAKAGIVVSAIFIAIYVLLIFIGIVVFIVAFNHTYHMMAL